MSKMNIKLAAGTDVGLVRTNNEDNYVASPDLAASDWTLTDAVGQTELGKYGSLLVVADGMGGANAGEVASEIAVNTIREVFSAGALEEALQCDDTARQFIENAVRTADDNIYKHSKTDEKTRGMGTTIVLCWIVGDKAYITWCGDSRCYVFNEGRLTSLSKDHSYVQELVDKGRLSQEEARKHPYSNIITRCLGDVSQRAIPDTHIHTLRDGDIFLICSDGLCGLCDDKEIASVIDQYKDDIVACKNKLISAALSAGGYDNVTVALGAVSFAHD